MPIESPKRGALPSPKSDIAAATHYRAQIGAPPTFIVLPQKLSFWGNDEYGDCVTAEEAFAKACSKPEIYIPDDEVIAWAGSHNALNGAYITGVMASMQFDGFIEGRFVYCDGPYLLVDQTNAATLQSAIATGPVKLGVAADQLETAWDSTNGNSGWFATGFQAESPASEDHCVSLCGYGPISWLAQQLNVAVPPGVDGTKPGYAMFTWNSIGIIDVASMSNITFEAWLRRPTTVAVKEGSAWTPQVAAPKGGTSADPALAAFNGKLYALWKGQNNDPAMWLSSSPDGVQWTPQVAAPKGGTSAGPALAAFNGRLYALWKGQNNDQAMWLSSSPDGVQWTPQVAAPRGGTSAGPALAAFNGRLYALWKGQKNDQAMWLSSSPDGVQWTPQVAAPRGGTSAGPALAAFNGRLYALWKGENNDQAMWLSSSPDGAQWTPQVAAPTGGTSAGPALVAINSRLYALWKGENNDPSFWLSFSHGAQWTPQDQGPSGGTSAGPALAAFNTNVYALWKGENTDPSLWLSDASLGSALGQPGNSL